MTALVILALAGCSKGEQAPTAGGAAAGHEGTATASPTPSREGAIALLRTVLSRLERGEWNGMEEWFAVPKGYDSGALRRQLPRLIEKQEISAAGIDVLEANGRWGRADEVLSPERARRYCEKFGVDVARCFAFRREPAEVVVCRFPDGKDRLIRLDDVGKLSRSSPAAAAAPAGER